MAQLKINAKIVTSLEEFNSLKKKQNKSFYWIYTLEEPGGVIVFKKLRTSSLGNGSRVIRLWLPYGVKFRVNDWAGKCRAQYAYPLGSGWSTYSRNGVKTEYKAGQIIKPHSFSMSDRECAGGIHFFFDKKEAERY
jgi:hypothetical protein